MGRKTHAAVLAGLGVLWLTAGGACAGGLQGQWENYVSKHHTFTLLKPVGWKVQESWQQKPLLWSVAVAHPSGMYQSTMVHGVSPAGNDAKALVRLVVADLARQLANFQLKPKARTKVIGERTLFLFEGSFTRVCNGQNTRMAFQNLVVGGKGLMLNQRIEAAEGRLAGAAPMLLQTLANVRVAKNVVPTDDGGAAQANQGAPRHAKMVQRQLAGGWGAFVAPADWKATDLGKGQVILVDPTQQLFFVVASVDFMTPRYAHLARTPGTLVCQFCRPHKALAFACTRQGHGSGFQFQVTDRPDLVQRMRAGITGGRPCSVEHFSYTFTHKRKPYKGFSLGWCVGNYADAGFTLGHMSAWAPANQFDTWIPVLGQIMTSYQLNKQNVGQYIADGLRKYYAGIRKLSDTIARNSEQMRRENYALHMQRERVRAYTSYQTTRMIMGEFDYLASASGYLTTVRADVSGLYTTDGNYLTREPYGGGLVHQLQEINSRELYELVRPQ